ncbi:UNVERIFIED_CONTAM: hypothetical protein Slati_0962800 [Sesamum latifolium]|uniref:Retrotransposon Copia-like N-terminal domain-containing protein n=1 Tax=Sesamum latifolium TaxID=2727402 RepID=A0AAW2XV67_9LAMI
MRGSPNFRGTRALKQIQPNSMCFEIVLRSLKKKKVMANNDDRKNEATFGNNSTIASSYILNASDYHDDYFSCSIERRENYDEWARFIVNALRAKKKLGYIDRTVTRPSDDSSQIEDWWNVNSMLVAWVFNTIESSLHSIITRWNIIVELMKKHENKRTHQVLMGLDDAIFGTVRSNILSMEPITSLMRCGRIGHEAKESFQIIGYTDWWRDRPRGGGRGPGCGRSETTTSIRGPSNARVNATQIASGVAQHQIEMNEADRSSFPKLTNKQWVVLLNLLNFHKTGAADKLTGLNFEDADWSG